MTFPSVPLGQQFHHRRLADDVLDVAPRLSMHTAVDGPLNAGALLLRNMSQRPHTRVVLTNAATITNGSTVRFDTVRENTAGEYNPATGIWTASRTGMYLTSMRMQASSAASLRWQASIAGLDTTIYPSSAIFGAIAGAGAYEMSSVEAFPLLVTAGNQFYIGISNADLVPRVAAGLDACVWDIQYLGATPGPLAGQRWLDPLVASPWVDGEQVHDLKLSRRFTEPMNDVQPYLANFGQQFGLLLASTTSAVVTAGNPVPWNIDYVTPDFNLQSTDNTYFNIPSRTPPSPSPDASGGVVEGLWLVSCALVSGGTGQQVQFTMLDSFSGHLGTAGNGAGTGTVRIGRLGGRQVSVNAFSALTAAGNYRCFLAIVQLGG